MVNNPSILNNILDINYMFLGWGVFYFLPDVDTILSKYLPLDNTVSDGQFATL